MHRMSPLLLAFLLVSAIGRHTCRTCGIGARSTKSTAVRSAASSPPCAASRVSATPCLTFPLNCSSRRGRPTARSRPHFRARRVRSRYDFILSEKRERERVHHRTDKSESSEQQQTHSKQFGSRVSAGQYMVFISVFMWKMWKLALSIPPRCRGFLVLTHAGPFRSRLM